LGKQKEKKSFKYFVILFWLGARYIYFQREKLVVKFKKIKNSRIQLFDSCQGTLVPQRQIELFIVVKKDRKIIFRPK